MHGEDDRLCMEQNTNSKFSILLAFVSSVTPLTLIPVIMSTMVSMKPNKLLNLVQQINRSPLPESLRKFALTLAFNSKIKYAGTTGIGIQVLNPDVAVVRLRNRPHVQNHIGGVHATAMATLAESTTGMLFGLHLPDTHLPLLKSMNIQYVARATGNLEATASLTEEQKADIHSSDKGSVVVPVVVKDSEGKEPIKVEMEWAWIRKRSKL